MGDDAGAVKQKAKVRVQNLGFRRQLTMTDEEIREAMKPRPEEIEEMHRIAVEGGRYSGDRVAAFKTLLQGSIGEKRQVERDMSGLSIVVNTLSYDGKTSTLPGVEVKTLEPKEVDRGEEEEGQGV